MEASESPSVDPSVAVISAPVVSHIAVIASKAMRANCRRDGAICRSRRWRRFGLLKTKLYIYGEENRAKEMIWDVACDRIYTGTKKCTAVAPKRGTKK